MSLISNTPHFYNINELVNWLYVVFLAGSLSSAIIMMLLLAHTSNYPDAKLSDEERQNIDMTVSLKSWSLVRV